MNIAVTISGLDELKAAFKRSPQVATKEINQAIKQSIFELLADARPITPIVSGYLRGSAMQTSFQELMGVLQNIAPYAERVHDRFCKKHGMYHHFFTDSVTAAQHDIDSYFSSALDRIMDDLTK